MAALPLVACGDVDGDGLSSDQEEALGTSPFNADTDGDGLADNIEVEEGGDPLNPDSDGDGLRDGTEVDLGTDVFNADSDEDGLTDRTEFSLGTNPTASDSDFDGLDDNAEVVGDTDPLKPDTDLDGLEDGDEITRQTDPTNPDTDGDGVRDGDEITFELDPLEPDTDVDGFDDGEELFGGADPNDRFSWPWASGQWPNRKAIADRRLTPTGWGLGDTVENVTLEDQFGRFLELHQLYGYVVRLDLLWDGDDTSLEVAADAALDWRSARDRGYITVHAVFKRAAIPDPIAQVVQDWVGRYNLDFPVVTGGPSDLDDHFEGAGLFDGNDALTVLLDRDLTVRHAFVDGALDGFVEARDALLAAP